MRDLRDKTCGECWNFRARNDEERTGVCGGMLPEVKIWGSVEVVNPGDPEEKHIEPIFGTFRPEVHENDPCCCHFEDGIQDALIEAVIEAGRSPICAAPGCKCNRDGDSPYCVDHEDYEPEDDRSPNHKAADAMFGGEKRAASEYYLGEEPDV